MSTTSRRGRRISSKACDTCRQRKVQCIFEDGSAACRRCRDTLIDCTFMIARRPRGPVPNKPLITTLSLGVGDLSVEHLCAPNIFHAIINDFLDLVYPVLPLVHRPSFRSRLQQNAYISDAAFLRLCLALCAVTVASIPRKFNEYSAGRYVDVGAMIDRACHVVLLSRISSEPDWQNRPGIDSMTVSILLAMSSHYAGRAIQGWSYASEAIQFFRALELYREEGYANLSVIDGELSKHLKMTCTNIVHRLLGKRAFWVLYIIQIHDRLSFIVPHTGLSFDPLHTSWEFLLPYQIDDEDLPNTRIDPMDRIEGFRNLARSTSLPVISGFVALIKVFLCVVDLLSNGFPGSPPQAYAMTSGTLRPLIYPGNPVDGTYIPEKTPKINSTISLSALLRIIKKLQATLEELPEELKISTLDPQVVHSDHYSQMSPVVTRQFDTMRANIHITSLYIQSTILEACSNAFTNPEASSHETSPGATTGLSIGNARTQLWVFRKSIARELLEVLNFCSSRTLEANGSSIIVKIREIAATLLDSDNDVDSASEQEEQSRQYVAQFVDILANLDYMGQATIIPPIFNSN